MCADSDPDSAQIVLVVEDTASAPDSASASLRSAGYTVISEASGANTVALARQHHPSLILLDLDLPSLDETTVCQQLKGDAELSAIPIVILTDRSGLIDHMSGLAMGADEHVRKPYASGELLLRVRHVLALHGGSAHRALADADAHDAILAYDEFARLAQKAITAGPATLMLVRTPPPLLAAVASRLAAEVRRRDLLAQYSPTHLIVLAPDQSATSIAHAMAERVIDTFPAQDRRKIMVGAVETDGGPDAGQQLDALVARADLALAEARVSQGDDTERATVLVAEDDPDAQAIIDARLRAAGYRTLMAFDGEQALTLVHQERPDVLLLEVSLPKLTGFDVLAQLRELGEDGPRSIVVSDHDRDDDVTRAFELGADDYVPKPFNPDELVARIARLLR